MENYFYEVTPIQCRNVNIIPTEQGRKECAQKPDYGGRRKQLNGQVNDE